MIYLCVQLTVKDDSDIEEVASLLAEQCRRSREEPGCISFHVYHSKADQQIFILIEHWESAEALDVHRNAAACVEIYKPKVLPLVDRVAHECELIGVE